MNNKLLLLPILFFLGFGFVQVSAQKKSIENVSKVYLHNMGTILKDSEVKGYYLLYRTDKLDRKTYSYELVILDQNLNSLASKSITGSYYFSLVEGVYNEDALVLKFYDGKTKEVSFHIYDQDAKLITEDKRKAGKMEALSYAQTTDQGQNILLFPIDKAGAVDYRMVKNKSYGFEMTFFPTSPGYQKWSYGSDPSSKDVEVATFIYGDENVIISSIIKKPSMLSRKVDMEVLAVDARTGKKLFQNKVNDPNYELFVLNGFGNDDDGNIFLFGSYYEKGDSELNNASLGLFSVKIDKNGNILSRKFSSWEKDVSIFLPVNQKGKIKSVGYTYFHEFIRNADGNIYAIGEQYRKQTSASGVAVRALGGSASTSEMAIEDIVIFEFDKDFTLENVNIIEKEKTIVALPQGAGINGPQILSYLIKATGGFDYQFLQLNKDKSIFTVGYLDYMKVKGADNKYYLGAITYTDSKFSLDKIDLVDISKNSTITVLPGKIGNFLLVEYNPKEKRMNMRMEKINY